MATISEKELLDQIKVLLFDSNIQKDMVDFDVKYNPKDYYFHYFIKLKNIEKNIIKGRTNQKFISDLETEKALKILNTFSKIYQNNNLIVDKLDIYHDTNSINGKNLYFQTVVPLKENPKVLFFPELKLLYFSKKIKLYADGLDPQELSLDFYKENVTSENFELKASELIELIKIPIGGLVNISDV